MTQHLRFARSQSALALERSESIGSSYHSLRSKCSHWALGRWICALSGLAVIGSGMGVTPAHAEASPEAVWVFFRDKGIEQSPSAREQALVEREHQLSPRALKRRRRARHDRGVDLRDLRVVDDYVAQVKATGARIRVESRWFNAVSVFATPAQQNAIATLADVDRIEPVRRHHRAIEHDVRNDVILPKVDPYVDDFGQSTEQLEAVGAVALARDCGLSGEGIVVGVQDSGFALDHDAFSHLTVLATRDFINDDDVVSQEPGDPPGQTTHGTLVMGTLAGAAEGTFMGIAPNISVLLSKTERVDVEVIAEEDYYIAGLEWIEAEGADIFTASLGYLDWYSPDDLDGQTSMTSLAVDVAFANGLAVFASMGNSGPGPTTIAVPADAVGAISVGATTLSGSVAGFSSRGPTADGRTKPDISAPGADVYSVQPGSTTGYQTWSGTSAAAPMAAGLAALVLEARPELTAAELADLLRNTASQADAPDNSIGWGIVDGVAASGGACGCSDADGDGFLGITCGGEDCNDQEASVYPGATEVCDGLDNDCDGSLGADEADSDGDGVLACLGDCDDNEPTVAEGFEEICGDGLDNDCQGGDEVCPATSGPGSDSGAPADESGGADSDPSLPGGTGSGGGMNGSGGADDEDGGGCGCTSQPRGTTWGGLLTLLLGAGLRRRRR